MRVPSLCLRPLVTLAWGGHAPACVFFQSDGQACQLLSLADDDSSSLEAAISEAFDWGRDPSRPPPPGWRYASIREIFPLDGPGPAAHASAE
jgi:hypothetical protein